MTPLRQREALLAELAGLKDLLQATPQDTLATPLMKGRVDELEKALKGLDEKPPIAPEAELFFTEGPALGHRGLEAKFASDVLDTYQNMVTNHYSAKHYGALRRAGRRRGEAETRLFLTALPRGSFGLQLTQLHVSDFVAASDVSTAMQDISGLLEAATESDTAFERLLASFNPRVLKPLTRFLEALHTGGGQCRIVTGLKETKLTSAKIADAFTRVSAAKTDEEVITITGTFGGVLMFSWEFDFQPEAGDTIRGALAEEVTEQAAEAMNHDFTNKAAVAKLKATTVETRSGKKKPTYELIELQSAPQNNNAQSPP
jgi:hypothetical protein